MIGAEQGTRKVAVEVKSFLSPSPISDFYTALGQFLVYRRAVANVDPERTVFLAVPLRTYRRLFIRRPVGQSFVESGTLFIVVFNETTKEILQWIPDPILELL